MACAGDGGGVHPGEWDVGAGVVDVEVAAGEGGVRDGHGGEGVVEGEEREGHVEGCPDPVGEESAKLCFCNGFDGVRGDDEHQVAVLEFGSDCGC